jgi:excisionase family DNA binding protein
MKKLTTSEVAARLGVGKSTVNLWCNQGKFPNAESVEESRGPVWLIPESDLNGFVKPKAGRPPKAKTHVIATPAAIDITLKLNKTFRDAREAEEASKKKAAKRGKK